MLISMIVTFVLGYIMIVLEHPLKIDKAVSAIFTGVICWVIIAIHHETIQAGSEPSELVAHHLGEIAQILLFLIGAMTIVELVDSHKGFNILSELITSSKKSTLLILVCFIAFFLSALLDNLTTTIVMVSLVRKLIPNAESRKWYAGFTIIAANAGGAWSPLGDVTTTMLWIGAKVSTEELIKFVFFPSVICLLVPMFTALLFTNQFKGNINPPEDKSENVKLGSSRIMLITGFLALISVPVFKTLTHLPPYLGMMFALAVVWLISEFVDPKVDVFTHEDKYKLTARYALSKIEIPGILFFFGVLTAVSALDTAGILSSMATQLDHFLGHKDYVAIVLGVLSAVIDNVPLVAASMGMFELPKDHEFWHFIAYSAGTGGSMLIIGSAAGIAAMGMENIDFIWYLKKIGGLAALGFIAGCIWFLVVGG
ncbi:MAG: sodium:proton antiporter NhaD [Saprospiraceae bacterium]|nr:sodium:proton antiporter NhaD [Saprospiraceae bacterium]MBK7810959.1 sodium:proton antiporter NhaD [Saprospiraceae bacterium]MBK9630563.1 sodium:proton antiporter NhaD [Saprospiraceae bacterium]